MKTLRDRNGRIIGKIETRSDGQQILRDGNGRRVSEYSPRDNVTRDRTGRRIGFGDLLVKLLED